MTIVYIITSPSGKSYVGITSRTLVERWREHCNDACGGSGTALHKAIRKYGPEAFRVEVIEETETWDEACAREQFWITWIGTKPPFGYNLTDGGDGAKGCIRSEETRAKMSAARKGRTHSEEARAKMSASKKGRTLTPEHRAKIGAAEKGNQYAKGRTHSEEARAKMSAAGKGRVLSDEHRAKISAAAKARSSISSPPKETLSH